MKNKVIQKVLWLAALASSLAACKKNDTPKSIDLYSPITEGRVFLPVLAHKPDMEKVKKTEKSRKGEFKDVSTEGSNDLYEFSYTDMDIKKSLYAINKTSGVLMGVLLVFDKNDEIVDKLKNLAKKNGFGNESLLSKACGGALLREKEELFIVRIGTQGDETLFAFVHFGKQPGPMPAMQDLGKAWEDMIMSVKINKVQEHEANLKSTLRKVQKVGIGVNAEEISLAQYTPHKNDITTLRSYYFSWKERDPAVMNGFLSRIVFSYENTGLGCYKDEMQGEYFPTKEFLSLIEKENYKFHKNVNELCAFPCIFKNEAKNLKIDIRIEEEDGKTFLNIEMSRYSIF